MSSPTLLSLYQKALKSGTLQPDSAQAQTVTRLNNVSKALTNKCPQTLKGVYIYGPVGRGKSMLMNLFCDSLRVMYRRVHFHAFMEELHHKMHTSPPKKGDPLARIAKDLANNARVLCFDEFYITNIADAMMLGRLFKELFAHNVLIVATSNWALEDLFQGGVNRQQFMPFIKLMRHNMDSIEISGGIDYRTQHVTTMPYYLYTDHYKNADSALQTFFSKIPKKPQKQAFPAHLTPKKTCGTVAWYSFNFLCDSAISREDYLTLTRKIDTLILENIPYFSTAEADAAIRFITLIDILYENHTAFICTAADAPHALCPKGDAAEAFKRTASRIMEMQAWPTQKMTENIAHVG